MNSKKMCNVLVLFVLMILMLPIVFAASTWSEPSVSTSSNCAGYSHVMCAELGENYSPGPGNLGLIPYSNESGAFKTYDFCAITYESGSYGFKIITGSPEVLGNISALKNSSLLGNEFMNPISYDFEAPRHYDENCNADEMFERDVNGRLDLSRYIENGVVYDVSVKVSSSMSNLDYFDLIGLSSTKSLLNLGTSINGSITDSQTGAIISGVNVTLYFKNQAGSLQPYLSFISDESGIYDSLESSRTIVTYYRTYTDVSRIPLTDYIVVAQHPQYETFTSQAVGVLAPLNFDFKMQPFSICQPDCTYQTDSTCHSVCDGINGCALPTLSFDSTYSLASKIDGLTKGFEYSFVYDGSEDAYVNTMYGAVACEADPVPISTSSIEGNSQCGPSQNTWKTERVVNLRGQLVRMFITYCE
jgi:hypothetical protein